MARSRGENKIFRGMERHIRFRNKVTACIEEMHTNRYREKFIEEYKMDIKSRVANDKKIKEKKTRCSLNKQVTFG